MSDEATGTVEIDDLPTHEPAASETPPAETPPAETAPAAQEPDDLRKAMTDLASTVDRSMRAREPQPQPRKFTPEEEAKLWAIYDPEAGDKEFFKKFGRFGEDATPEQIQAYKEMFAGMQKGLMQQAITGSQNLITIALDQLHREWGPIREYVESSRREATRGRFYDQYDSLNDPKYESLIGAVANTLANKTFEDEDAYFKALAEGAAENIKKLIPEFDLGKKTETRTTGKTPKLPRTTVGGGGGAGKGRMDDLKPTGSRNDIDTLEYEDGQS